MSNQSLAQPESTNTRPNNIWTFPELDDDVDEADFDDDEDEVEDLASSRNQRWFSRSGFGSPEWWSRL